MNKIFNDIKQEYKIGGIVNKFIYWNIGIYVLSLVFYNFKLGFFQFPNWLALSSNPNTVFVYFWTLITYAFLHDGFWHIFFNMLVLNFSGRLFLTYFTEKQFFGLYVLSTIFSGICFVLGYYILNLNAPLVGASAAIMSILVATTTYQPLMNIRLQFIGGIKLWHLTTVILLLDLMNVFIDNTGGHIAHLAGAFFGFIFIKSLQNGLDFSKFLSRLIAFFSDILKKSEKKPFKKVYRNPNADIQNASFSNKPKDKQQQQIDEILDKISKSGYESLSAAEKDFLFKIGK